MGRRTTKSFSLVLLHDKFKQTKVKTKIINGSPAPVYKGVEAIECLQIILQMLDSASFFNATHFLKYYHEKMETKKGGGRDGLTPEAFLKHYAKDFDIIARRCLEGTYNFSPYNEKLVLKGRAKNPRVLSIPSMRDRMVLGVLNQYLQEVFPKAVNHEVPNQYIEEVSDFLAMHSSEKIFFFKTDIKSFYDSIDLNMLYAELEKEIEPHILQLVMSAIDTTTISTDSASKSLRRKPRLIGIPQGLAISNILASISMMEFDTSIKKRCGTNAIYKRYVDDILILSTSPIDAAFVGEFKCELIIKSVTLRLSVDKTQYGVVGVDSFDYIGYVIQSPFSISIRKKNVQTYLNRMSRLITRYKNMKEKSYLRPIFIREDKALDEYYVSLLNRKLAGFKISKHLFGWLPYFQAMTDINQLYEIDSVIHHKFMKGVAIESHIRHLPEVYWDIKKHAGKKTLIDYDALTETGDIRDYLLMHGLIDKEYKYEDYDIKRIYNVHLENLKKDAKISIGTTY